MSTRSDIIVEHNDGTWKRVYCHFDGYPDGVGATLFEHYSSQERAESVVAPGDMSSLYEHNDKPEGHSFDNPVKGYTVYYSRDRGQERSYGKTGTSLSEVWPPEDTWTEFTYVWKKDEGCWFIGDPDEGQQTLKPLEAVLNGEEDEPKTAIKTPWGVIGKRA